MRRRTTLRNIPHSASSACGFHSGPRGRVPRCRSSLPLAAQPSFFSGVTNAGRQDFNRLPRAMARLGPSDVKSSASSWPRPDIVGSNGANARTITGSNGPSAGGGDHDRRTSLGQPLSDLFEETSGSRRGPPLRRSQGAGQRDKADRRTRGRRQNIETGHRGAFQRDLSGDMLSRAAWQKPGRTKPSGLSRGSRRERLSRSVRLKWTSDWRLPPHLNSPRISRTIPDFRARAWTGIRTSREILVMEWIDGILYQITTGCARAGLDPPALGRNVIQAFLRHAVRDDGLLPCRHAPGKFVRRQRWPHRRRRLRDHGPPECAERKFLAEILFGFITRLSDASRSFHFDAGYVPRVHGGEFAQAIRAVGEPIHSRTADQISMARVLTCCSKSRRCSTCRP